MSRHECHGYVIARWLWKKCGERSTNNKGKQPVRVLTHDRRQNRFVLAVPFFQRGEWRSATLGVAWRSDLLPSAGLKLEIISTSTPDASDLSEVQTMRCVRRSQKWYTQGGEVESDGGKKQIVSSSSNSTMLKTCHDLARKSNAWLKSDMYS